MPGDPPTGGTFWGLQGDAGSVAVIDSYLANFRDTIWETTAIKVTNGTGPFKIANNYIEAAGQSVMFGGQDPSIPNLVPADIEVRGNYMTKQLAWRVGDPAYAGTPGIVKNVFELKNAQRVRIDGNISENDWKQADQDGFAIVVTTRHQNGGRPGTDGNVSSDTTSDPASALGISFPGAVFTRKVMLGGNATAYPAGNWFPAGATAVVNAYYGGSDYRLVSGSPYHNAATDGRDVGA